MDEQHGRFAVWALAICLGVIGFEAELDTGYVLDWDTGLPLSGVHVVGVWHGQRMQLIRTQRDCFDVLGTTTDGIGRYLLLSQSLNPNPLLIERFQYVLYYKPGYAIEMEPSSTPRWRVFLKPDKRKELSRIEHLLWKSASAACGSSVGGSAFSFFRAIRDEAVSMATSEAERQIASQAQQTVDELELGWERAQKKWEYRR